MIINLFFHKFRVEIFKNIVENQEKFNYTLLRKKCNITLQTVKIVCVELQKEGLIEIKRVKQANTFKITDKGKRIYDLIREIIYVLNKEE